MKLLTKNKAKEKVKKEKDSILNEVSRLREYGINFRKKIDSLDNGFDLKKIEDLKKFEQFCKELLLKKSALLEELTIIEEQIEIKKEVYYSLVNKQDELDERLYQLTEKERKLDLRETFIKSIEAKQNV